MAGALASRGNEKAVGCISLDENVPECLPLVHGKLKMPAETQMLPAFSLQPEIIINGAFGAAVDVY